MTPMPGNLRTRWENWAHGACWLLIFSAPSAIDAFPLAKEINTLIFAGIGAQVYFWLRLRSNGILIGPRQYPDIHASIERCRARFGNPDIRGFVLHQNELWLFKGGAAGYRSFYLSPSTIDNARAMSDPRAMDYFIGREMGSALLGHGNILRGHLSRLALVIPFVDIWHRRCMARSRDRAGLWACGSVEVAERCLAVMAAGPKLGMETDLEAAKAQWQENGGHWKTLLATSVAFTPHATERIAEVRKHAGDFGLE